MAPDLIAILPVWERVRQAKRYGRETIRKHSTAALETITPGGYHSEQDDKEISYRVPDELATSVAEGHTLMERLSTQDKAS